MASRNGDSVGGTFDGKLADGVAVNFWQTVRRALEVVFFAGEKIPETAIGGLERLRTKVSENDELAGAVYNLDPFQIAADLAGVAEPMPVHRERYLDLLKKIGQPKNHGYTLLLEEITPTMVAHSSPDDPVKWRQRAP